MRARSAAPRCCSLAHTHSATGARARSRPPAGSCAPRCCSLACTDFPVLCGSTNLKVRLGPTSHEFLKKSPVQQREFEWRRSSRLAKRENLCKDANRQVWSQPLRPAALVTEGCDLCSLPSKPGVLVAEGCGPCLPTGLRRELQGCSSRNVWACAVGEVRGDNA